MKLITIGNETKSQSEWARIAGISLSTFCGRLKKGISGEELLKPVKAHKEIEYHGMTKHPLYKTWSSMRSRCCNTNHQFYNEYGGRGIGVCDEWSSFINFHNWAISSGYSNGLTLDRIDNNGGYEPNNCRWVTMATQSRNKRSNVMVEINGESKTLTDWARTSGVKKPTIFKRYHVDGLRGIDLLKPEPSRNRFVTINGVTKTLKEWSDEKGINRTTIIHRLNKGIIGEDLFLPTK